MPYKRPAMMARMVVVVLIIKNKKNGSHNEPRLPCALDADTPTPPQNRYPKRAGLDAQPRAVPMVET
jgi:hypothetical protein